MTYIISRLLELKDTPFFQQYVKYARAWSYPYLDVDWDLYPSPTYSQSLLREDTYLSTRTNWVIHTGEQFIGLGFTRVNKITDKDNCNVFILIVEAYQKKGYAKILAKHMLDNIDASGIRIIHVDVKSSTTNDFFVSYLDKMGFKNVYKERMSGSAFNKYNRQEISKLAMEYKSSAEEQGYHFEIVKDGDISTLSCTNEHFYKMREDIWNDMPSEDADWEPETYDEKVHQDTYKDVDIGESSLMYIALKGKEPVGLTETWINPDISLLLHQGDTGVIKGHRGHRLGLTLKLIMLDTLLSDSRTSQAQFWVTGNAGSNEHMIRINDTLQYKELEVIKCYEIDFTKFNSLLNV